MDCGFGCVAVVHLFAVAPFHCTEITEKTNYTITRETCFSGQFFPIFEINFWLLCCCYI